MKTRGIENAIRRLEGARKMQSPFLIAKAEEEARHLLTQARAWLARTPEGERDERRTPVAEAAKALEGALLAGESASCAGHRIPDTTPARSG